MSGRSYMELGDPDYVPRYLREEPDPDQAYEDLRDREDEERRQAEARVKEAPLHRLAACRSAPRRMKAYLGLLTPCQWVWGVCEAWTTEDWDFANADCIHGCCKGQRLSGRYRKYYEAHDREMARLFGANQNRSE